MGPSPKVVVYPLLLLLLLSFISPTISLSSSGPLSATCTKTPLSLTTNQEPQGQAYSTNITYYSITMPPTAPAGFSLNIYQPLKSSTCSFEVFVGDDSYDCPNFEKNLRYAQGVSADLSVLNFTTSTYYIGVRAVDCSSLQVAFQISAICPSFCNGPGAHCSTNAGCFCASGYYEPLGGCYISGACDPSILEHKCAIMFGYGNQTCHVDWRNNSTYLGACKVAGCKPGFFMDTWSNTCRKDSPPPPPQPSPTAPSDENKSSSWWRVGTLGTAASISIWCAEAFGILAFFTIAIVIIIRKRRSSASIYRELELDRAQEQL